MTIGTKPPISTPAPLPIDEAPPPTDKPAKEPVDEPTDEPTDEPSPGGGGGICGGTKIYMQPSTWSQGAWQHFIVETQSLPDDSAGNEVVISVGVSIGDVTGDYATGGDVAGDYATFDKLDDLELVEVCMERRARVDQEQGGREPAHFHHQEVANGLWLPGALQIRR